MQEGYIKFHCDWEDAEISKPAGFDGLNLLRNRLYAIGLIGMLDNGIGFGNVSMRLGNAEDLFIITGSATGGRQTLQLSDYSVVLEADIERNYIKCVGKTKASSESLTHFAGYCASGDISYVAHIHSRKMWFSLMDELPSTAEAASYGTPLLAEEVGALLRQGNLDIVMKGHEDGLIFAGKDAEELYNRIEYYWKKCEGGF